MQTIMYKIKGAPEPVIKNTRVSRKTLDPYNHRKLGYQMQLADQHQGPKISGAWALDIQFHFDALQHKKLMHNVPPSLTSLLKFIDEIAHGVIYDNDCIIYEIRAMKDYVAGEPETILIFTRR